jgi:hypothetical protein
MRRKVLGLLTLLPQAWLSVLQRMERNTRIALDAHSLAAAFKGAQARRGLPAGAGAGAGLNQRTPLQQAEEEVVREAALNQQQQHAGGAAASLPPQPANAFDMWLRVSCITSGRDRAQELRSHLTPSLEPPPHLRTHHHTQDPGASSSSSGQHPGPQHATTTRAWLHSLEACLHVGVWLHERG